MRTLLLLVVCVGTISAAPVPKALKNPSLEQRLIGTWTERGIGGGPPGPSTAVLEFKRGGELSFRVTYTCNHPPLENTGRWALSESTDPTRPAVLRLEIGSELVEEWTVMGLTGDTLTMIDTVRGSKERYERVDAESKKVVEKRGK